MSLAVSPDSLIMSLHDAVAWRQSLHKNNQKLVVTNGCFDLLHRGHAEYLNSARNLGDAMLLLLNSDSSVRALKGPDRPINNEADRAYLLACFRCIDAVVVFDSPRCTAEFTALKPDIYVKGGDYTIDTLDPEERQALLDAKVNIEFIPFIGSFSTTETISRLVR